MPPVKPIRDLGVRPATAEEMRSMLGMKELVWQRCCFIPLFINLGWHGAHVTDVTKSYGIHLDWLLWRERILHVELKAEGGRCSADQSQVIGDLLEAGGDVKLWYPRQWRQIELELATWRKPTVGLSAVNGVLIN